MLLKNEEKISVLFSSGILGMLPPALSREILRIGKSRRDFPEGLSEIRVRGYGYSGIVLSGENLPLVSCVTPEEVARIYDRAVACSAYAHTRELRHGYVSLGRGVRVGILSSAASPESGLPEHISGLVFRLPTSPSESCEALYNAWIRSEMGGMLIYSPPGGGKTSALRALAGKISRETRMRVAVVDERREFIPDDYSDAAVDILAGYSKPEGIEIAERSLSAEVLIVDEIGNLSEAEALLSVGRGGLPIIATAHASTPEEVYGKESLRKLLREGYFKVLAGLYRENNKFLCDIVFNDGES